jgi:chromosome segregation protein
MGLYLKKLKIHGFKSFADPICLEFSKGISAIVGPNGSGKSNITDAIKWVLGEQSIKSLRGKKMEDVLFSGTEKKPPSNFAEVTLIMDNHDATLENYPAELSISRKLFRSGDSDYSINKKSCKLKDVHHIFMDTGLGKNGYSLISQGGIENIISSSPTELRGIFEEAVGIVSYKAKKHDAEKKLEHTQENLERLWDIQSEIKKQLGPLKAQSHKANTWLKLHEELKTVDLVIFFEQMTKSQVLLSQLENSYAIQLETCKKTEVKIEEKDTLYQHLTIKNRDLDIFLNDEKSKLSSLKFEYDELQEKKIQATSRIESNKLTKARLIKAHVLLTNEITENHNKCDGFSVKITENNALLPQFQEEKKSIGEILNHLLDTEKKEIKCEHDKKESALSYQFQRENTQETLHKKQLLSNKQKSELEFLLKRKDELANEKKQILDTLDHLNDSIEKTKTVVLNDETDYNQLSIKQKEMIANTETNKQTYDLHLNNLKINHSKLDYLKNIQKNYQDYFPVIQKLMTSEKLLGTAIHHVYGPIGELLNVENHFAQAINIALGGKSQNIVVATIQIAKDCIQLLKTQQLGRATFLPLDNLRYTLIDNKIRSSLQTFAGFEGIANECVTTKSLFKPAIDSLLGRTIIASDFSSGKAIQKAIHSKFTIVTLGGEIFYPGGAIVGGQNKNSKHSPLFKKIEIERLSVEILEQKESIQTIKKTITTSQLIMSKNNASLQKSENNLFTDKQSLWKEKNLCEVELKNVEKNDAITMDLADREFQLNTQILMLSKEISDLEEVYSKIKPCYDDKESNNFRDEIRLKINIKRDQNNSLQLKTSQINSIILSLNEQLQLIHDQITQQKKRQLNLDKEILDCDNDSINLIAIQENCISRINQLSADLETQKNSNDNARYTQKENTKMLSYIQDEIKKLNHDLILQNNDKNNFETKINGLKIKMDHWEKNIFEQYDMNYLMVEDIQQELMVKKKDNDLDLSEKRQRELKIKIENLGTINHSAIKAYEEILVRHEFMQNQMDDLQNAKRELLDIINTLYDAMTEQFKEKFIILQENFTRIFSILFEGGRAYLEFTDPTGILDGGIELVAQPPGKRLRHISLLSGGEKAMVAIALLFSFLEINPSPFCVIDEIDAALDDHNIYRYISYLKNISEKNQFITITHRRKTLEVCNNLYGVSMSRDGISQLVSVRLSDYI